MKNLIKLCIIFLAILIIFSSKSIAVDRILPLPKPKVDQETKIITAKKKEIYPQKKPIKKIEEIVTSTKILDETGEITPEEYRFAPTTRHKTDALKNNYRQFMIWYLYSSNFYESWLGCVSS